MISNEIKDQELKELIEQSVDESVERAFKKYGRTSKFPVFRLRSIISLVVVLALIVGAVFYIRDRNRINEQVPPVEDHVLTLENDSIFGFTIADFEEPILGASTRQQLLIVEEREAYVNTTITDAGLFNLGVFNKQQVVTIYGVGQYTIDLEQIGREDISLNEETYELTIRIPHATLHQVSFDPSKTEVGDTQNGWFAFGSIKLDAEQQKSFEVTAVEKLTEKLNEAQRFKEADRFAVLSAYETYQPIVKTISPAYKVVIEFE